MQIVKTQMEVLLVLVKLDILEVVWYAMVATSFYFPFSFLFLFVFSLHNCIIDINECSVFNGGCSSNALCTNTQGSFICTCNEGYSGDGKNCVVG